MPCPADKHKQHGEDHSLRLFHYVIPAAVAALFTFYSCGCGGGGSSPGPTPTPKPTPTPSVGGRVVAAKANDVLYNAATGKLYVSVPSADANNGNTIVPVDPATGNMGAAVFVGSEPGKLALSDDNRYLYVALNGAAAVRRIDLSTGKADQQFSLGADSFLGSYYAGDLAVAPGHPEWLAVVRSTPGYSPAAHDVALFINGTQSPNTPAYYTLASRIAFGSDSTRLYGYNDESSGFDLYRFAVDANGITKLDDRGNIISGFSIGISFQSGLLFAESGQIIDPEAGTLIATLSQKGAVCPDMTRNRVYIANGTVGTDGAVYTVYAFDATRFTLIGSRSIQVAVNSNTTPTVQVTHLTRWGANGMAFCTSDNHAVILDNAAI
jgi:hypothetical protein